MGQKEPEWEKSVKWLAQENFGRQAREYNANALLADSGNLKAFVSLAGVTPTDRVLDVATGTGFLATALSVITKQVVATDLTMPMLEQARVQVGDRGSAAFALADAENLPFASESFDVVACRVALHHFPHPLVAFDEMARVCRSGGRVVIMDIVSSEDRPKSDYHNRMEQLRDPSHVRQYSRSEIEEMMRNAELQVTTMKLWSFTWECDEWLSIAGTDDDNSREIRAMMLNSIEGDKSGLQVESRDGDLFFTYASAVLVARK